MRLRCACGGPPFNSQSLTTWRVGRLSAALLAEHHVDHFVVARIAERLAVDPVEERRRHHQRQEIALRQQLMIFDFVDLELAAGFLELQEEPRQSRHHGRLELLEFLRVERQSRRAVLTFGSEIDLIEPETEVAQKRPQVGDLHLIIGVELVDPLPLIDEVRDFRADAGGLRNDVVERRPLLTSVAETTTRMLVVTTPVTTASP